MITLVEKILVIQISQRKEREMEGCERDRDRGWDRRTSH